MQSLQVLNNQIFQVRSAIEDILLNPEIDLETGEIISERESEIEEMQIAKEVLVRDLAVCSKTFSNSLDSIDKEIKRLQGYQYKLIKAKLRAIELIRKNVPEGKDIIMNDFEVTWRKSSSIEVDDSLDIEDLSKSYPNLVDIKTTYSLKKVEAKAYLKNNGVLPKGVTQVNKLNMSVK